MAGTKYLIHANKADLDAATARSPVMRDHFLRMAVQWRAMAERAALPRPIIFAD